jgi:hypothetical protein
LEEYLWSIRTCGGISENEAPALASIPFYEMPHVTFSPVIPSRYLRKKKLKLKILDFYAV